MQLHPTNPKAPCPPATLSCEPAGRPHNQSFDTESSRRSRPDLLALPALTLACLTPHDYTCVGPHVHHQSQDTNSHCHKGPSCPFYEHTHFSFRNFQSAHFCEVCHFKNVLCNTGTRLVAAKGGGWEWRR